MALTGKYTTTYDIIERVRRSRINDFTEEEAKEWIYEAMSLIGDPKHFEDKVAVIPIEGARGQLPYDLYDLTEGGVRDYYTKITLNKETNIYYDAENVGVSDQKLMYQADGKSLVYIDGIQQDEDIDTYLTLLPPYSSYPLESATYKINYGFLFTGFKTGLVELAYKAFPVDNENNPMIEDNFKVVRAVVLYIMDQVAFRMNIEGTMTDRQADKISQKRAWAIGAAKSDGALGSVDDMEAIRARQNRLYRDPNMQSIGFNGMSNGEHLNIKGPNELWGRR